MPNIKKIVVLPGDGIGKEITDVALKVLKYLKNKYSLKISVTKLPIGGSAYDQYKTPLPAKTLAKCKEADAILLGAVGGHEWDKLPFGSRPERALLKLRKELLLYANVRPIEIFKDLIFTSPLKEEVIKGVDLVIIRELTGGIYFGEPRGIKNIDGERKGINCMVYSESEIRRIAEYAFKLASTRNKHVCSVDKANVLETSMLWREVVEEVATKNKHIKLTHQYVDNAAMQLIKNPSQFDCILTGNMFGDILSDLSAMIPGSIGLLASMSLGPNNILYEPIHGSAPDIAGKNIANPLATIICLSLMFEHTFSNKEIAQNIKNAVIKSISLARTEDIRSNSVSTVTCQKMGDIIINNL